LVDDQWLCDDEVLETLHYGLANRRMIAWSRSLSPIRKSLGFLDDEASEDLVDVGEEDDGVVWKCRRVLSYRWSRNAEGRWAYRLRYICMPDEIEGGDDG
jgi:hypothetical protein